MFFISFPPFAEKKEAAMGFFTHGGRFFRNPSIFRCKRTAKTFHALSTFWLVHLGQGPAFFVLPSRFPNGRFAPRTKNSCTYSNGYCSGLSPDFLIPAPAKTAAITPEHNADY
jgi:hypothetical protein